MINFPDRHTMRRSAQSGRSGQVGKVTLDFGKRPQAVLCYRVISWWMRCPDIWGETGVRGDRVSVICVPVGALGSLS